MEQLPDDMLFYYNTTAGETFYFSVYYSVKRNKTYVTEIHMDEMWELIKAGNLELKEISPADFPHKIPANIDGTVKAFII